MLQVQILKLVKDLLKLLNKQERERFIGYIEGWKHKKELENKEKSKIIKKLQ